MIIGGSLKRNKIILTSSTKKITLNILKPKIQAFENLHYLEEESQKQTLN